MLNPPVTDDGENLGGVIAGTEAVTTSNGKRTFQRGPDYDMDYLTGTLTPKGDLVGKTVDILFIAPPITRKVASPVTLDIPNSRPAGCAEGAVRDPHLRLELVGQPRDHGVQEHARGMGLRVYLDRPWFSSGDGERLGVVDLVRIRRSRRRAEGVRLGVGPRPALPVGGTTNDGPTVAAFRLADATRTSDLSLEELPGVTSLHVAGHRVDYDASRRLWYADLEIDAGPTYLPFVRLALARFQPISVAQPTSGPTPPWSPPTCPGSCAPTSSSSPPTARSR